MNKIKKLTPSQNNELFVVHDNKDITLIEGRLAQAILFNEFERREATLGDLGGHFWVKDLLNNEIETKAIMQVIL